MSRSGRLVNRRPNQSAPATQDGPRVERDAGGLGILSDWQVSARRLRFRPPDAGQLHEGPRPGSMLSFLPYGARVRAWVRAPGLRFAQPWAILFPSLREEARPSTRTNRKRKPIRQQ
jgi:hypothetical protein